MPPFRRLWLVKCVLVIPHYVVLLFLWLGFVISSVVAFCWADRRRSAGSCRT